MQLFFPNLAFEDELAGRTKISRAARHACDDLAHVMGYLGTSGDQILLPETSSLPESMSDLGVRATYIDPAVSKTTHVVPWGWSDAARDLAVRLQMPPDTMPSKAVVSAVNSREFGAAFDIVPNVSSAELPFAEGSFGHLCGDMDEWRHLIRIGSQAGYHRWVAKPLHSHAGRNRLLLTGATIHSQQQNWLQQQWATNGAVYLEPWVDRLQEAGLQFHIEGGTNQIHFVGVTELLNDARGQYRGSLLHAGQALHEDWKPAIDHAYDVVSAVAKRGYFGPIGIDCFRFATSTGRTALRLCNDINARYTMGRIALTFERSLTDGEFGLWRHLAADQLSGFLAAIPESPGRADSENVRAVVTSPKTVTTVATVLVVAKNADQLRRLSESF